MRDLTGGGIEGNKQLTVLTGIVLVVLLAAIGVTILHLHTTLLWVHLFIGLLLIGPVLLKLASTGYRFVRYYTRDPVYRRKGPPPAYLRALGPLVVLTTLIVFASGVLLLLVGPSSRSTLLPIHKVSFIVWLALTAIHVLGHLPEVTRVVGGGRELRLGLLAGFEERYEEREERGSPPSGGRGGRALALTSALIVGLVLAVVLIPQFSPWLHYHRAFVHR